MSVCLYPINVNTAEPIRPKFFCGTSLDPSEGLWMIKFWKSAKSFVCFVLQCIQIENVNNCNRRLKAWFIILKYEFVEGDIFVFILLLREQFRFQTCISLKTFYFLYFRLISRHMERKLDEDLNWDSIIIHN